MGTESNSNNYTKNASPSFQSDSSLKKLSKSCMNKYLSNNFAATSNLNNISAQHQSSSTQIPVCSTVPFLPIEIDENFVIEGAIEVLKIIRPSWDLDFVQFKRFTDGITNKLVGCFYNPPKNDPNLSSLLRKIQKTSLNENTIRNFQTNSDAIRNAERTNDDNNDSGNLSDDVDGNNDIENAPPNQNQPTKNVVLVRVYGSKTDLLIDRKAETRNIILLHSYGFAPSLYATFKNGLVYEFVPGVTLDTKSVLQPEIWPLVAQRMAEMHHFVKPDWDSSNASPIVPMLWKKTQSFFDLVPVRFSDAKKHKRLEGTFLPISRMRQEFADLYKHLEALGSPLVFAHNDLLLGNVIYTESSKTVTFIDYEYADYNYQAFDIGNHFAEFAGVDTVDYSLYPTREFQLKWLRVYLQTYLQRSQISDAEVETLYVQVNQFALAAHFFWTIWCLIQAELSTLDFDYVEYAFIRYNEYLDKKKIFLALDAANVAKCKI